ncbi:MAG: class I SAM-dependent methyltransferase, partial [Candidatus Tectomicrobia bacterium]|nr:class I SAM-dependent methyltransferase [Candidatus Tectomicrobia bacterium]
MTDSLLQQDELTRWEQVALTQWGKYLSGIEKRTIMLAHQISPEPECALEIGCDGGRWSQLLADLGWQMVCTDIKPHILQTCKSRLPEALCLRVDDADVRAPLQTESIGLLLCIEVPVIKRDDFILEA